MTVKTATPETNTTTASKRRVSSRNPVAGKIPAAKPAAAAKRRPVLKQSAATLQEKTPKKAKKPVNKAKVVRDSFTMPQNDFEKIAELKQLCLKNGLRVKKSELLRAGLHELAKLKLVQLKQTLAGLEEIKTGRPKKK